MKKNIKGKNSNNSTTTRFFFLTFYIYSKDKRFADKRRINKNINVNYFLIREFNFIFIENSSKSNTKK